MIHRTEVCCRKCALLVSGVSYVSEDESAERCLNNIQSHYRGRRCRGRQQDPEFWKQWEADAADVREVWRASPHIRPLIERWG